MQAIFSQRRYSYLNSICMFPIEEITIAQLHAAYLEGKTAAREVTEAYLERIAAYDKRGP